MVNRLNDLDDVIAAADLPCEHPEQARGENPFCEKCLSCRAGMALLGLTRIANEQRKVQQLPALAHIAPIRRGLKCPMCGHQTLVEYRCGCTYCSWQGTPVNVIKEHQT